jgi:putative intracellular protease/amidase
MKAHLYVFEGWADWEPSFATAGLNNPQFQRDPGRWSVHTVAVSRHPVRSMGGVITMPDLSLVELGASQGDLLLLPGGPHWEDELIDSPHRQAVELAERYLKRRRMVGAICGATAGLAHAGLLDARAHTSNAASYLKGTGYDGAEHYRDEAAVDDDGLITAGGMAPLEFARALFARTGLYEDDALEAWYALNKTGKPEYFARMRRAAEASSAGESA